MKQRISSRIVGACFACAIPMIASATIQEGRTDIAYWERCSALQDVTISAASIGLPTGGARVTQAALVPAGGQRWERQRDAQGKLRSVPGSTDDLNPNGEYCLVEGEILSAAPNTHGVIVHLALPSRWNGKSLGVDGRSDNKPPAPVNPISVAVGISLPLPIARGYAVYSHEWGTNARSSEQQESLKKAHDVAMFLIGKYYGKAARYRYHSSAGGAGYESLALIQKYPEDYEGILTQCPVFSTVSAGLHGQAIRRASQLNGGAGEISPPKAAFLRKTVLAACDQLDGLEDSLISNVEACKVDFAKLRCPGGKDTGNDCFSDAQLNTLQVIHTRAKLPYALPSGETHLPAYSIGVDWDSALRGDEELFKGHEKRTRDQFLGGDPNSDVLAFDPLQPTREVLARIQELSRSGDRSAPDMDRFIARGGKWILTHGWSDEFAAPSASIEHYRKLVAKYGQAKMDRVMRLYLIPGYAHGSGIAFSANGAPNLEALEDWVERGIAPGTLTVVDTNREAKGRSRPMCVYPAWSKYNGSGDPDLAANFSCVTANNFAATSSSNSDSR